MVRKLVIVAGCLATHLLAYCVSLAMGLLSGNSQIYHSQFIEEREFVAPIIASNRAFANVAIFQRSNGGIWLGGHVESQADFDLLLAHMTTALGEMRVNQGLVAVDVVEKP